MHTNGLKKITYGIGSYFLSLMNDSLGITRTADRYRENILFNRIPLEDEDLQPIYQRHLIEKTLQKKVESS